MRRHRGGGTSLIICSDAGPTESGMQQARQWPPPPPPPHDPYPRGVCGPKRQRNHRSPGAPRNACPRARFSAPRQATKPFVLDEPCPRNGWWAQRGACARCWTPPETCLKPQGGFFLASFFHLCTKMPNPKSKSSLKDHLGRAAPAHCTSRRHHTQQRLVISASKGSSWRRSRSTSSFSSSLPCRQTRRRPWPWPSFSFS